MNRHHFFVSPSDVQDEFVDVSGSEGHHAARVLRVRPGEAITVADGSGRVIDAVVTEVGNGVRAEIRGTSDVPVVRPAITLYQAVAKGDRMDDVVTKAVEVGVARIVPFLAERTIVRWGDAKRRKATERWKAVARAAAKQCRAPRLTVVEDVLESAARSLETDGPALVLHEQSSTRLRDVLPAKAPQSIAVVVGPEGGLTEGEVEGLAATGADIVSLGERILRTETAGMAAAVIIAYVYGSLG